MFKGRSEMLVLIMKTDTNFGYENQLRTSVVAESTNTQGSSSTEATRLDKA